MKYFIRIRGKSFGPFGEEELRNMKAQGKVGRTTEISVDGIYWKSADSLPSLFPPAAPPSGKPATPEPIATTEAADWFYSVNGKDGFGPVTTTVLTQMVQAGTLRGESFVWKQGQNAAPLKTVPPFAGYVSTSPESNRSSKSSTGLIVLCSLLVCLVLACIVVGVMLVGKKGPEVANVNPSATPKENSAVSTPDANTDKEKSAETDRTNTVSESSPTVSTPSQPQSLQTEDIVAKVEQSVARLEGRYGSGTGFLVRPRILATNHHVISCEFPERIEVVFPSASQDQKGPFKAKLLYADADRDIAFLSVESKLPALSLATNHRFRRGQDILVVGSPGELENAVNIGVLSSEKDIADQKYYQLGISINSGNSGGPVIAREGNVIGVVTLKSTEQEGIAYCVPIANVVEALDKMEKLTESEKTQNNSRHRAEVALRLLALVNHVCQDCMKEYDLYIKVALEKGYKANDGINAAAEEIESRMERLQFLFLDNVEKELRQIQKDTKLPSEFRVKLAEFYSNCMEIKSYVDNPRGTVASYKAKLIELTDTGDRLRRQLTLLLGVRDE